ncbi:MAG: SMC-Scp complex subunit ScpB [Candidatus Pacearchaeota archaeon]|nr:MAG: SMC-Scp complex subunit ScpB [Candidatus Pacearchaeota archaeon]
MKEKNEIKNRDLKMEKEHIKKVEAILFISARYLNLRELVNYSDLNPIIIKEIMEILKKKYNNENSAIEIIEKTIENTKTWKMDVKQEFYYLVNRLASGSEEFSKAEKETLAIIAYKQPVKQSVVVKIRGNKAYDHIKKFYELGLINKKKLGRTQELTLSEEFYNYFNIKEDKLERK